MKAWLAFKHTTGIHIQHTRDIKLRNVFDLQLIVVVSTSQSTKHRVTLFHYVVLLDIVNSTLGELTKQCKGKDKDYL